MLNYMIFQNLYLDFKFFLHARIVHVNTAACINGSVANREDPSVTP
jgi:hypothetical protein